MMANLLKKDGMFTYLGFPVKLRKHIYTSNPIEGFNSKLKRDVRKRVQFNSEDNAVLCIVAVCKDYNARTRHIWNISEISEEAKDELGFGII